MTLNVVQLSPATKLRMNEDIYFAAKDKLLPMHNR